MLGLGAALLLGSCAGGSDPLETRSQAAQFEYDRARPLRVHVVGRSVEENVLVEDLTYESPGNGTIAAYLVRPERSQANAPAIVFLHWTYHGPERGEFLEEATAYGKRGVVSLLVGEETALGNDGMVVDLRRGVDLLLQRGHVDPARIGYVGHSLGAVIGGVLAGVETRIRTYVLMAGGTSFPPYPEAYIGDAAPASLFFQLAELDDAVTPEDARLYASRGSEPKRVTWYDVGHDLDDPRARADRAEWLAEKLGFPAR